ncbi:PKD domain-containing protein [Kitasatospora sp. NPDC049285]|uniref:PKD domain-containing protein n=1 Tax=Kitasatospora sp. NPDC049285 TaxID=3157096 RepID=UPI003443AC47
MRSRRLAAAAFVALAAGSLPSATATAGVTDLYVDKDSATCADDGPGSVAQPYCHVSAATRTVLPGQTVHIGRGTYDEAVALTRSGTPDAPVTFVGADAVEPDFQPVTQVRTLTVNGAHDVRASNLQTDSGPAPRATVTGSDRVVLDHVWSPSVWITGASSEVTLSRSTVLGRVTVEQSPRATVTTNRTNGISVDHAPGSVVTSNTVRADCGPLIRLAGGSDRSVVENNLLSRSSDTADCTTDPRRGLDVAADSVPGTVAKYNSLQDSGDVPYVWAGVEYRTAAAFRSATGQGDHDLLGQGYWSELTTSGIDAADSDAPGQLDTDRRGYVRIDDAEVADTGSGRVTYHDRGADETTNPLSSWVHFRQVTDAQGHPLLDVEAVGSIVSPWLPASGTIDFGDGSAPVPVGSGDFTVRHTYPREGYYGAVISARDSAGKVDEYWWPVQVALDPITGELVVRHAADADRLSVHAEVSGVTSPRPISGYRYDFGDGTAPVTHAGADAVPADHRYARPGTYQVSLTVTDDHGRTAEKTSTVTVGGAYVPLAQPVRVMDTRTGLGAPQAAIGRDGTVRLKVTGTAGLPDDGSVAAVLVNLTGTNATEPTHVIAYDGTERPGTSNLNPAPGRDTGNAALVPVAADGTITVYNHGGSIDLIADLEGYYSTGKVQPLGLYGVPAVRALDTRNGTGAQPGQVGPDGTVTFKVRGPGLLPDTASVAVLNLTATGADQDTYVAANPTGVHSSLNVSRGATVANQVTVPIDADGNVTLYNHVGNVQLIADVQGYYGVQPDRAGQIVPIRPVRALDTRNGPMGLGGPEDIDVRRYGIPAQATAVLVNLTGLNSTQEDWLAAGRSDTTDWTTSNLNLAPGAIVPNLALVPISDRTIRVTNHIGITDAVVDFLGYVTP